jgi:cytochrome b pre-mRNA-processing protein 3
MLAWLKKSRARRRTARSLYGSIVTAARERIFYADWGVPDTIQGRFEMIVLHLVPVLRRLGGEGEAGRRMARALSETFVVDMDDIMREMTFGDLAVPREIKRATAALYDRHQAYLAALAAPGEASLQEALKAQMAYLDPAGRIDARSLSGYVRKAVAALDRQPAAQILAGQPVWPDPPDGRAPLGPAQ